jgi:hypothetical protein
MIVAAANLNLLRQVCYRMAACGTDQTPLPHFLIIFMLEYGRLLFQVREVIDSIPG